ncbi:MAG: rRNA maturation RNase YbeY [Candidatus Zambryskibacteria bacterium]|nr:rRNA maturation RNase YbeY [Candidatus Zambryskibacteria bacterium]
MKTNDTNIKVIEEIKNDILGKRYKLSFAFISKPEIQKLNKKYRRKNEPTDVLSFNLDRNLGEILICPIVAKKKALKFYPDFKNYFIFLVIHAMLHLKGLHHGSKMEEYEFTYYRRYRRRHLRS